MYSLTCSFLSTIIGSTFVLYLRLNMLPDPSHDSVQIARHVFRQSRRFSAVASLRLKQSVISLWQNPDRVIMVVTLLQTALHNRRARFRRHIGVQFAQ